MTIATTTSVITYLGNGSTTAFTFPFVADQAADLVVTLTSNTGVSTVLNPSLYSVILNPIPTGGLWAVGGTVNYPLVGSAIAAGTFFTIQRAVPYIQSVSIINQGAFYPQVVEQALDVLELQIQQLIGFNQYTLRTPVTDVAAPNVLPSASARANGYLAFDANGQPIVTTITSGSIPGSTATARKVSTTGTATINVLTSDSFGGVSIYQSATPVTTIQLPTSGGPYPIFDGGGNAASANITVLPPAGKTIDGAASYVINTNFQSVSFYYDSGQILIGGGSQGLGNNISVPGSITAGTTLTAGTGITSTTGNISAPLGLVSDSRGDLRTLSFVNWAGGHTLISADNGRLLYISTASGGLTVPSAGFAGGSNFTVFNATGVPLAITQGAGATLLFPALSTSGNRTLANLALCTIIYIDNTTAVISGAGVT